jgi:hypothetical protein
MLGCPGQCWRGSTLRNVLFRGGDGVLGTHTFALDGAAGMVLTPLTSAAARAVLTAAAGGAVADEVADLLVAPAAGNPLALVELPTTLSPDQLHLGHRGLTQLSCSYGADQGQRRQLRAGGN